MTDLKTNLASLLAMLPQGFSLEGVGDKFAEKPCQNTLAFLGLGALVFYQAEKGTNPKVNTIYDALEYCSSSLSVGYTNIFPHTPIGKLVATLLMTFGPAMSNAILAGPKDPKPQKTQEEILATLQQILTELKTREAGAPAT